MALGIEPNSIAPALIRDSGQALVQGIRQIGQQISGHLTEMQTKRDLAGLAQEMQGMNPQSADFPVQLMQIASRHPLAVRDERGQMAMSILGKAHGAWQASENDAMAFNRAMALQGYKQRAAATAAEAAEKARASRPVEIFGKGLVDPVTRETLVPEGTRAGPVRPTVLSPGAKAIDASGKVIAENLKLPTGSASEARLQKKLQIDLLNKEEAATRQELGQMIRRRDDLSKQRMEIKDADNPNAAYLDNTIKAIEAEAKALRDRRLEIQKRIEAIEIIPTEDEVEPELGAVPAGAVAPPAQVAPAPAALPAAANPSELVPVINPSGKPTNLKRSQVEAALQYGYKLR